ncbi:MAG: nucleotidyltransferase domain-containing protein [Dehalococcoidia bacterium]
MPIAGTGEETAFDHFIDQVKRRYQPQKVLLFGSRARGEASPNSDYDLLVVASTFEGTKLTDRATEIYRTWPLWAGLDCICLTPAEFERSRRKVSIVREIDREGIAL